MQTKDHKYFPTADSSLELHHRWSELWPDDPSVYNPANILALPFESRTSRTLLLPTHKHQHTRSQAEWSVLSFR